MANQINDDEFRALSLLLEHFWKNFEFRLNRALQILNYFIITLAIISAAYVSALSYRLHLVAIVIALMGALVSISAFLAGRHQVQLAARSLPPLQEARNKIAEFANMTSHDSRAYTSTDWLGRVSNRHIAIAIFCLAGIVWLGAAIYAIILW